MSKTLKDIKLIELMPASLRYDKKIIAACEALQPELVELQGLMQYSALYSNIDNLPESILQYLAWENGVYGPEWSIAKTLEKRRELVKNSFLLNKLRGTRWSIERIFEIVGWAVEIKEWFEENADPYTFRISILNVTGVGLTEDESKWILALMESYKPVSRHLTSINVTVKETKVISHVRIAQRGHIVVKG